MLHVGIYENLKRVREYVDFIRDFKFFKGNFLDFGYYESCQKIYF